MNNLTSMLHAKSIAVIGGGAWCEQVILQSVKMGFRGDIWPVHPKVEQLGGYSAFKSLADLPRAPDAVFIGVNRFATITLVGELAALGAGGAVSPGHMLKKGSVQSEALSSRGRSPVAKLRK